MKEERLGSGRAAELYKLCSPDFHAKDWKKTPFNISQIDLTCAKPLLAGRSFGITRGVALKKRCGNAVPTPNKKEDCTK